MHRVHIYVHFTGKLVKLVPPDSDFKTIMQQIFISARALDPAMCMLKMLLNSNHSSIHSFIADPAGKLTPGPTGCIRGASKGREGRGLQSCIA